KPRLLVIAEASNVTGELVDIESIAEICKRRQLHLMVDAAQSAGFTAARIDELGIALWCASGHKGLLGLPGVGLLYVAPHINLERLVAGGTGSRSDNAEMTAFYSDHLESGTLPVPAS